MQNFATLCALAATTANAISTEKGTMQMNVDNFQADVQSIPQGDGQDHTLWSWGKMVTDAEIKVAVTRVELERTVDEQYRAQSEIDSFRQTFSPYDRLYERKCELYRREEVNLYYQCTQDDYNNYALDHFGGEMRSYPRWLCQFCKCNDTLRAAEHARVEGRWCEPESCHARNPMCDRCGADPVDCDTFPPVDPPEPTFKYLPNFSGYWIERLQEDKTDRESLDSALVQGGYCLEQKPNPKDPMNMATLSVFPTGTAVSTVVHDVRLRDGEFVEATTVGTEFVEAEQIDGVDGVFGVELMHYGILPINEQMVKHPIGDPSSAYDAKKPYLTKIGSCDNRGEEKLWQFQLFPEVEAGLTDEFVKTEVVHTEIVITEEFTGKGADYRGHQTHARSGVECQRWTAQTPHAHTRTAENYPGAGLGDHNYCRNPDGEAGIWCYTMDSGNRWELCDPIQN